MDGTQKLLHLDVEIMRFFLFSQNLICVMFATFCLVGTVGIVDYTNYDDMKFAVSYLFVFLLFHYSLIYLNHEFCMHLSRQF